VNTPTPDDYAAANAYAATITPAHRPEYGPLRDAFLAGIAYERERAERDVGQVLDIAYGRDPHPDHCLCDDCERARMVASKRGKK
jgi:hypothetical protein